MAKVKTTDPQISTQLWLKLITASLFLRPRSFSADAIAAVSNIIPSSEILGLENIPRKDPCLVTCNHYTRPGLDAWWGPLLISAAVASQRDSAADGEIHWVTTAAWTFPDSPWRRKVLTPITRWAFERVARVYGFITMPPMPPAPDEVYARATAVRRTLRLARDIAPAGGMIGLAPEGRDTPGVVGTVPEGVGDFIAHLCKAGMPILPVALSEPQGCLRVSFGSPFIPVGPAQKAQRDDVVARQVMETIRNLAL